MTLTQRLVLLVCVVGVCWACWRDVVEDATAERDYTPHDPLDVNDSMKRDDL